MGRGWDLSFVRLAIALKLCFFLLAQFKRGTFCMYNASRPLVLAMEPAIFSRPVAVGKIRTQWHDV
jgi:hypothetical protein